MEEDKKLMDFCMEIAKQGIDIEKLFKDLEPVFEVLKQVTDLGIKNYKFMKGLKDER